MTAAMSSHTPAPWVYYNVGANQNGTPVYSLASLYRRPACVHDGLWIADIRIGRIGDRIDPGEGLANARLIAKAPDLFAMLIRVRGTCHLSEDDSLADDIDTLIAEAGAESGVLS